MPLIVKSSALKDIRYYTFFGHKGHNYSCFKFLCIGKGVASLNTWIACVTFP